MFDSLYITSSYGYGTLQPYSIKLLIFSHLGTTLVAIAFGFFLWRATKKLSSFYLFLTSLCFGLWCFFDLATWAGNPKSIMFSWSIIDIFLISFFILSYWFLYAFVKNTDLPIWQKITSLGLLFPTLFIIVTNLNVNTFYSANYLADEAEWISKYNNIIELCIIFTIIFFIFFVYKKTTDTLERKKFTLAGLGVVLSLITFSFLSIIGEFFMKYRIFGFGGPEGSGYIFETYGLFGMPILLAFLGYLIMKYQAFDLKPIKSVALVIGLMLILFVSVFI